MVKINLNNVRRVFDKEVDYQMLRAIIDAPVSETVSIIEAVSSKIMHTESVFDDGLGVASLLGFNQSLKDFASVAFLNHDIGCFEQLRCTGNYNDCNLYRELGIKNHGELGAKRLNFLINDQLPLATELHEPIKKIVNDHVGRYIDKTDLYTLYTDLFKNYSIDELLSSAHKDSVIGVITQIIQDVEKLDVIHQILNNRWKPIKTDDDISPLVFDIFYQGGDLKPSMLRSKGLWNANVGELIRLDFINQIRLVSVAKYIQKENLITKLKIKRNNPKVIDAFNYINQKLDYMIKNSEDGITLKKVR